MADGRTPTRTSGDIVLAAAIRTARKQRFWTQAELAAALTNASGGGVTVVKSTVSRWETGERRPTLRYLQLLHHVLEIPESLLGAAA